MRVVEVVASTSEPAFAIDERGSIIAWNRSAELAFGYHESETLGRGCWGVLASRDLFGNHYCSPGCPLIGMARQHHALHRCELLVRSATGRYVRSEVSSLVVPGDGADGNALVHVLHPKDATGLSAGARVGRPSTPLTRREAEVLELLSEGAGTVRIGEILFISPATVRNHVRHILRKLDVHSRLEAVSVGRHLGLLGTSESTPRP